MGSSSFRGLRYVILTPDRTAAVESVMTIAFETAGGPLVSVGATLLQVWAAAIVAYVFLLYAELFGKTNTWYIRSAGTDPLPSIGCVIKISNTTWVSFSFIVLQQYRTFILSLVVQVAKELPIPIPQ